MYTREDIDQFFSGDDILDISINTSKFIATKLNISFSEAYNELLDAYTFVANSLIKDKIPHSVNYSTAFILAGLAVKIKFYLKENIGDRKLPCICPHDEVSELFNIPIPDVDEKLYNMCIITLNDISLYFYDLGIQSISERGLDILSRYIEIFVNFKLEMFQKV